MDDQTYRFLLRMPSTVRDSLREAAEASGRSLNGEIVSRLEASLAPARPERSSVHVSRLVAAATVAASLVAASAVGTLAGSRYASAHDHDGQAAKLAEWSTLKRQLSTSSPRS